MLSLLKGKPLGLPALILVPLRFRQGRFSCLILQSEIDQDGCLELLKDADVLGSEEELVCDRNGETIVLSYFLTVKPKNSKYALRVGRLQRESFVERR